MLNNKIEEVLIFSSNGNLIMDSYLNNSNLEDQYYNNMDVLRSGLYYVQMVRDGSTVFSKAILKQ